jgi:hypothetical protein
MEAFMFLLTDRDLTMVPRECAHGGNVVFVSKLFECYARYVELQNVDGIGKERLGFSAGGHLVVAASVHRDRIYPMLQSALGRTFAG